MNREGAEINLSAGEVAEAFTWTILEKANSVQEQTRDVSREKESHKDAKGNTRIKTLKQK